MHIVYMCTRYAHSLMTDKKTDNITQGYNTFLFIASVIQSKITRLTRKQDQMTEQLKDEKAKVNQQKLQIF